jgi:zinc protease
MIGLVDIEQINFDNGVRALIWSSEYEPGRATVRVRFGAGYRAFDEDSAPYASIAEFALLGSGIGELGEDDIDRLVNGRKIGFEFAIDDAVFTFTSETRKEDINDQLYLFAAKLANPRWDPNPVLRAKAASELAYNSFAASPAGVINRDLTYLVTDKDPRFATPSPEALKSVTPEGFREVWAPLLRQGPVEVLVFGDFDREAVVEQLQATFGALPNREPIAPEVANRVPRFPDAGRDPVVLEHRGDANQAAAVIAWKTGGGVSSLREGRQLEILTQLFNNRLMDVMREKAGASYSPQVWSDWPVDIQEGGTVTAFAQLTPEFVPIFFAEAERIARDLADNPPTADELQRVTGPLGEQIRRASTGYHFLLYSLEGATTDPQRIRLLNSIIRDYSQTSPAIMQFLADRYFGQRDPLKLAVIPEGQELAEAPEGALLLDSPVRPARPVSTVSGR